MSANQKKTELLIIEKENRQADTEESKRKAESVLAVFTDLFCKQVNLQQNRKGKPPVLPEQARDMILFWAKS